MIYRYDSVRLRPWMLRALAARGVRPHVAEQVVSSVIETSLRGVDSHGISLFPHYCAVAESGRIKLDATPRFTRTAPSLGMLDADFTYGHHAGAVAMDHVLELARETGFALVNVQNSSHFGAASYFALSAARAGLIGFSFTTSDRLVKVHNAVEAFFGTNPICFTAPLDGEEPLCLDMATSEISWNKVKNARRGDLALEPGKAFDAEGKTVTDPHAAVSLAPSGSYKGFGLGLMVEVLCSLLGDGPISPDVQGMFTDLAERRRISHCFAARDFRRCANGDTFQARLTDMGRRIRALTPLGEESVMVPGDPEKRHYAERVVQGIPMIEAIHADFVRVGADIETVLQSA